MKTIKLTNVEAQALVSALTSVIESCEDVESLYPQSANVVEFYLLHRACASILKKLDDED